MIPISVAIIVAHPDDETLWVGGTILHHQSWRCFILSLCRQSDEDRAQKFYRVLDILRAQGSMCDLNDEPEQSPLDSSLVEQTILDSLPRTHFDLIITHHPKGEYTEHRRHEEVSKAVVELLKTRKISTKQLWLFAYEDGNKTYLPKAIEQATLYAVLTDDVWQQKYRLITDTYGFDTSSWEAQTTPKAEAFWQFDDIPYSLNHF